MKITVLDHSAMGDDTPLEPLFELGDVSIYDYTDASAACQRVVDTDVIVTNKVKITADIMAKAKNLKLICVFATGYDNIDVAYAKKNGIAVCNVPGYSTESVTLFTFATALSLYSHLNEYSRYVKSGEYTASGVANRMVPVFHELSGKTWGVVGYGNIGKRVADIARSFGMRAIINKRTKIADCECVDIDTLCKESDIISLHCPLSEETRQLINKDRLSLMKPSVILINEARGAVVDEYEVANAIKEGKIGGFGCDVYSEEPFSQAHPYSEILNYPNVILTPHSAWGAYEARKRCVEIIASNIKAFTEQKNQNRVDI